MKNIVLLAFCQAVLMTGQSLMLAVSPFVGLALASDKSLATLPIGLQLSATLLMTMPAAFFMKRTGRRFGFLLGSAFGIIGSALAAYAVSIGSFELFCVAAIVSGLMVGFGTYYRFAAAEAAAPEDRGRAISYVLVGGVVAAVVGPNLAGWSAGVLRMETFLSGYLALVVVNALGAVALLFTRLGKPTEAERRAKGRPLPQLLRQPGFAVAVLGGVVAYGVMTLIMTATPLGMHDHHYAHADSAFIIQWHMLGMFLPSFVSGRIIARHGATPVMQWGLGLFLLCVALNLYSSALWAIWAALVLLGVGWNFVFVGATTLLTANYELDERATAQSFNDVLILLTATLMSFASAPLHFGLGWQVLNVSVLPLILLMAAALLWLRRQSQPALASAASASS